MADNGPTSMMNSLKPPGTRSLGASGIDVSALAWGMWRFRGADLASAGRLVRTALDGGISLLDTANVYGLDSGEPFGAAESLLGRVLEADAGLRRRFVLSAKAASAPEHRTTRAPTICCQPAKRRCAA
jgi:aryl-alcohol dehydrogenase-like predicted oxidoreductase